MIDGQTGLILPVPHLDLVTRPWRDRYDPNAELGVPPHVTVLFPWIPFASITASDLRTVVELAAATEPFEFTFDRVGQFPQTLWLDPQPCEPVRALTSAVIGRWPKYQPYDGQFDDVVPHLTIADGVDGDEATRLIGEISSVLPIKGRAEALCLFVSDGGRWRCAEQFLLGG